MEKTRVKLTLVENCGTRWPSVKPSPQFDLVLGTYEKVRRYRKQIRTDNQPKPAFKWVMRDALTQDTDAP